MVALSHRRFFLFFFFNDTATTEIYTLSLHDALPISHDDRDRLLSRSRSWNPDSIQLFVAQRCSGPSCVDRALEPRGRHPRSEEHTSELQSQSNLVCRLLLEKKNNQTHHHPTAVDVLR